MEWDLGFKGIALLVGMAVAFGLVSERLFAWRTTRWVGLIAGVTYFISGVFISEFLFGWATEDDLQPNIDGLSFDEVLLLATPAAGVALAVTWYVTRHRHHPGGRLLHS